jgi:hypothetical protein
MPALESGTPAKTLTGGRMRHADKGTITALDDNLIVWTQDGALQWHFDASALTRDYHRAVQRAARSVLRLRGEAVYPQSVRVTGALIFGALAQGVDRYNGVDLRLARAAQERVISGHRDAQRRAKLWYASARLLGAVPEPTPRSMIVVDANGEAEVTFSADCIASHNEGGPIRDHPLAGRDLNA